MTTVDTFSYAAAGSDRIAPSTSSLRALSALGALTLGVSYLIVTIYAPTALAPEATILAAKVGVAVCCVSVLVAAFATKLEPALWGIGYLLGLVVTMLLGQLVFHDAIFGGQLYMGGAAMIAFVAGVTWIDVNR